MNKFLTIILGLNVNIMIEARNLGSNRFPGKEINCKNEQYIRCLIYLYRQYAKSDVNVSLLNWQSVKNDSAETRQT